MKIISLVPSLTELLFDLGLQDQVIGRTKFCVHPSPSIHSIPKIGGTKNINLSLLQSLHPDLIIANKEENTKEDVEALQKDFNVYVSDISNYNEALDAILEIGALTNSVSKAKFLVKEINDSFSLLAPINPPKTACYLIWQNPYMSIGSDTFIHDMMQRCGMLNVFQTSDRYPTLSTEDIKNKKPELILLSSEPFPFKEKHVNKISEIFPESNVLIVDGEYFSWYGSRMLDAPQYFKTLISRLK